LIGRLVGLSILLGLVGLAGAVSFGKEVLTVIYRAEYASHVNLLIVLVTSATVSTAASFVGYGMTAARCFRSQIPVMVIGVVTSGILTLVLIPSCGLMGAGYALLASNLVQAGTGYLILVSAIKRRASL
jgi:O-antigen/teichoic acid export membrane protein